MNRDRARHLRRDRELLIAGAIVAAITLLLFARHWVGAFETRTGLEVGTALGALWGTAFTVLSYLTTTGFESAYWQTAQDWSGLTRPRSCCSASRCSAAGSRPPRAA